MPTPPRIRRVLPPDKAAGPSPLQKWMTSGSAGLALIASIFALYKSWHFDQRLAEIDVAQKNIELYNAKDAILAFGFGEATLSTIEFPVSPLAASGAERRRIERATLVTVPVTVKNLSKLPITIDFNEQWAFLGEMLAPTPGDYAEAVNASNDSYPLRWTRTQCVLGVSGDAWDALGLGQVSIAREKTEALRHKGAGHWDDVASVLNTNPQKILSSLPAKDKQTPLAAEYWKHLQSLAIKKPYAEHSAVGRPCTLLNGGIAVTTLSVGDEKQLKATYVVRGDKQWFSHLLRLHYRQIRLPEEHLLLCADKWWNPMPSLTSVIDWRLCPRTEANEPFEYRYQDIRQTLHLPTRKPAGQAAVKPG